MSSLPLRLLASLTLPPTTWLIYDYKTQHPLRAHTPFSYSQSSIRLTNILKTTTNTLHVYTPQTLSPYNSNNPVIKFAVSGIVYDVSNSDSFKFKGPYSIFSGRDSTYCLAKMSMSPSDVGKKGELTEKEKYDLDSWIRYFDEKYDRVGTLSDEE
ncbi:hypothetical protein TrLO_g6592 [Triparma laevis f. longispina]|uniref:Cytochrome b5 heme-binding domain-containing protein n=1 Tax=Triparma laevis f. longispina TaxID=1714387 RepID=A0A9W7KXW3_9STRA|nr:hypothetical protein TrLO_g6592 [Triparma laevis f. longispina]